MCWRPPTRPLRYAKSHGRNQLACYEKLVAAGEIRKRAPGDVDIFSPRVQATTFANWRARPGACRRRAGQHPFGIGKRPQLALDHFDQARCETRDPLLIRQQASDSARRHANDRCHLLMKTAFDALRPRFFDARSRPHWRTVGLCVRGRHRHQDMRESAEGDYQPPPGDTGPCVITAAGSSNRWSAGPRGRCARRRVREGIALIDFDPDLPLATTSKDPAPWRRGPHDAQHR